MKHAFVLILLIITAFSICCGGNSDNHGSQGSSGNALNGDQDALFPVKEHDKWGYMNKQGKIVIKPQFYFAGNFSEGLADVQVIKPPEPSTFPYSDTGLPPEATMSYIDTKGNRITNDVFNRTADFPDGLAEVFILEGSKTRIAFIDKSGTVVIDLSKCNYARPFSEGLASVEVGNGPEDWRNGYIDKTGKLVIGMDYLYAQPFSEGLAAVCLQTGHSIKGKWGYIDKTGKVVIDLKYSFAKDFSEGLGIIAVNHLWEYIDKEGNVKIKPFFSGAEPFSEGLAAARLNGDDKWGYIDKSGNFVISPQFYGFKSFHDGVAAVQTEKKPQYPDMTEVNWKYIDKTGSFITEKEFKYVDDFAHGLARVVVLSGGSYRTGYINTSGHYVRKPSS